MSLALIGHTLTQDAPGTEISRLPADPSSCLGLVLLGGPGSGKGTQAESLSREFRLPQIGTGGLFRDHMRRSTELGIVAKRFIDRGELAPDEIAEGMVRERLAQPDTQSGFILDGFPRTLAQAESLKSLLPTLNRQLTCVLCIVVSDDEIVRRLSGRLNCSRCQTPYHTHFKPPQVAGLCDVCNGALHQRDDDNPITIRARLKTFHARTEPLMDYYRKAELLWQIDGEGDISAVTSRSIKAVRSLERPKALG